MILDFDEREAIRAAEDEYLVDKALAEGREEGQKRRSLQIAANLLKLGISREKIMEATGLSSEEIQYLAADLRKQA